MFEQGWLTIPLILTKRTVTCHLNSRNTTTCDVEETCTFL